MRISDWSSDVCSSDLFELGLGAVDAQGVGQVGAAIQVVDPDRADAVDAGLAEGFQRLLGDLVVGGGQQFAGLGLDHVVRQDAADQRSEEHTSELQSLMRISYAVFCLKNKKHQTII